MSNDEREKFEEHLKLLNEISEPYSKVLTILSMGLNKAIRVSDIDILIDRTMKEESTWVRNAFYGLLITKFTQDVTISEIRKKIMVIDNIIHKARLAHLLVTNDILDMSFIQPLLGGLNKTKNKNELFDFSEVLILLQGNSSEGVKVIQGLNTTGKLDFYQKMRYSKLIQDYKINESTIVLEQMNQLEKEIKEVKKKLSEKEKKDQPINVQEQLLMQIMENQKTKETKWEKWGGEIIAAIIGVVLTTIIGVILYFTLGIS